MTRRLRPKGDDVVVEIETSENYGDGPIMRPVTTEGFPTIAMVVAIGENEKARKLGLEEGQRVQLRHYGVGRDRELPEDMGENRCVVDVEDIVGIYEVK